MQLNSSNNDQEQSKEVSNSKTKLFHLKIYAPFNVYFDGEVKSVSAVNSTGPFDVLANHHNFLTLLNPCDITIRKDGDKEVPIIIKISKGIMQIKKNDVVVFLDV
ncbi:F0F1 ATP synthase subunit epsilon [Candidatus Saccharibacteria bacterium]|nr:F0F1 ATP synthase subunit epsilon [Candidatus Saccharibacteria bacterium]MDQ5953686.1 hypothetical protein [Patescibacteria group bacterium]MDQ5958257.1 hypothetical protein [Patescibacteria group bacterium]